VTTDKGFLLKDYLAARKGMIDDALNLFLPGPDDYPPLIFQAVRYSLFAGGKRLRPVLCLASAEAVGGDIPTVLPVACALEMIHTYSLIHDDLPAMDDDDMRRGRPTSHRVFGEAAAVLAGDALLTEAFSLMSARDLIGRTAAERLLQAIHEIAEAAGFRGMIGGQIVDIQSERQPPAPETLDYIHAHKTGALILASVRAGALLSGAGAESLEALSAYGRHAGLAFQIADDILNVEGDRSILGKDTGSDAKRGKMTFPGLWGLDASRAKTAELVGQALSAIRHFGDRAEPLRAIARYMIERNS
jgi:geranylgeranyl diphosphate synthase type II